MSGQDCARDSSGMWGGDSDVPRVGAVSGAARTLPLPKCTRWRLREHPVETQAARGLVLGFRQGLWQVKDWSRALMRAWVSSTDSHWTSVSSVCWTNVPVG